MSNEFLATLKNKVKDIHEKIELVTPFGKNYFSKEETIQYCQSYESYYEDIQNKIFSTKNILEYIPDLNEIKRKFYFVTSSEKSDPSINSTTNLSTTLTTNLITNLDQDRTKNNKDDLQKSESNFTVPEALAALYVFEGSTLGGAFISRKIKSLDWPTCEQKIFLVLNPYQEKSGKLWNSFKNVLIQYSEHAPTLAETIPTLAEKYFVDFYEHLKNRKTIHV